MNANNVQAPTIVRRPAVYLEMTAPQGKVIILQPTPRGRRELNNFWREWISDLLLSSPIQHKVAIQHFKKSIVIRPRHGSIEDIAEEVMNAAEVIRPLKQFTRREQHAPTSTRTMSLKIACQLDPWKIEEIAKIRLPHAKITCRIARSENGWYEGFLAISRSQRRCPLSIGELGRMLEYKIAVIAAR